MVILRINKNWEYVNCLTDVELEMPSYDTWGEPCKNVAFTATADKGREAQPFTFKTLPS